MDSDNNGMEVEISVFKIWKSLSNWKIKQETSKLHMDQRRNHKETFKNIFNWMKTKI